ncbi:MAG: tetratricopeptide repeat protein [Candidatus Wolfebacteria bacterium]|nr:tetratricopeptide repeat protein [Candidatus Wolfebacteria bacterium]
MDSQTYDLAKAQTLYEWALGIYPQAEGPHYQLARIYFLKAGFSRALNEINTEIKNFPDFKRSYYVRGLINGYAKNFSEAAADFQEFLKWDPKSWAAHNDLAWVYFQAGDYENALKVSEEGLKWSPGNPWLLNSSGVALLNLGKKKEAEAIFAEALAAVQKLSPDDWKKAYPGNDPDIASGGLENMILTIKRNQELSVDN